MAAHIEVVEALKTQVPGFKPCLGGEELKRASTSLLGVSAALENEKSDALEPLGSPFTGVLSWMSLDFEPDPYIKDLLYSIRQYACRSHRNPDDTDAVYSYGLTLQEIASKLRVDVECGWRDVGMNKVIEILELACNKYKQAIDLQPGLHAALYNWGVALSELAGLVRPSDPARSVLFLHLASQKYAQSIEENPCHPQALNNWGLVLQEVSNFHENMSTKLKLAVKAVDKFRRAIRLRPDFDHGCYNLGTIFYTHACKARSQLQKLQLTNAGSVDANLLSALGQFVGSDADESVAVETMLRTAGCYITLAYALQPGKEVYQQSLRVVQSMQMLPKPYLYVGYLSAPRQSDSKSSAPTWEKLQFVLDHETMKCSQWQGRSKQLPKEPVKSNLEGLTISVSDIVCAVRCVELSLPEGAAFWVQTKSCLQGTYFVAEDCESADCWVDALTLCEYIHSQNRSKILQMALIAEK